MSVETTDLRPDHTVSRVIRGGWQLAGDHGPVDRAQAIRDMEAFVDAGLFTFDCADIYTGVEEMIGDFIADLRSRRGASVADRVCVHTKLVPDLTRLADLRLDEVTAIVDRSLKRLKIDRLDLVQFFWWDLALGNAVDALDVLRDLQKQGKIKTLGTTNWDRQAMQRFVDAGFDIASAQVQYSVLDRRPANGLSDWGAHNNVHLICYGTLAGGFITEKWLGEPDPGFQFENRSLIKYRLIIDEFGPWERFQSLLKALKAVGDKHGSPFRRLPRAGCSTSHRSRQASWARGMPGTCRKRFKPSLSRWTAKITPHWTRFWIRPMVPAAMSIPWKATGPAAMDGS